MKIFNNKEDWTSKVNFVDENNVFVGYDTEQGYCEDANWFIADKIIKDLTYDFMNKVDKEPKWQELDNAELYRFDQSFFYTEEAISDLDAGGVAVFKLCSTEADDKYLHLYNSHNGYYGHGFEFKVNDKIIQKGCL